LSTRKELQGLTKEQLGQRAKRRRIAGWESMKKMELVEALAPQTKGREAGKKSASGKQPAKGAKPTPKKAGSKSAAAGKPVKVTQPAKADKSAQRSKAKANPKGAAAAKPATAKKQLVAKGGATAEAKPAAKTGSKLPKGNVPAAKGSPSKKPQATSKAPAKTAPAKTASVKAVAAGAKTDRPTGGGDARKSSPQKTKRAAAATATKGRSAPPSVTPSEEVQRLQQLQEQRERRKDLAAAMPVESVADSSSSGEPDALKDRVVLIVRDPFWLQATWDVTRRSVERAKVVMAEHWHTCRPVLRLLQLDDSGTTSATEAVVRDIEIHGGVRNWYIEAPNPPSAFRVQLGYLTPNGRFHELAISNGVQTPPPGGQANVDDHWTDIAEDFERIYAQSGGYSPSESGSDLRYVFERQLKRSMGVSALTQFGSGAERSFRRSRGFHFELDAELLVFGSTLPDAQVTIDGRPVKLRSDGSFAERLPLPDRRQVLPATACSRDGVEQQTIVLAVERNTKVMEVLTKEAADDGS
jgi:uncharacterized protein